MTRVAFLFALVCLAVVAIGVTISGCREGASSNSALNGRLAPPTPEERFQRIVAAFRRAVDTNAGGMPTGLVYRDETGHSSLSIRNDVTDELIRPTKEGEPYRGKITVASQYSYSLIIPQTDSNDADSSDSDQHDKSAGDNGRFDASQGDSGVDVLDDRLISAATKKDDPLRGGPDETVARRTDQDVRTYELAYENDRWVLKTELDPETEQSIQNAFEHALAIQ